MLTSIRTKGPLIFYLLGGGWWGLEEEEEEEGEEKWGAAAGRRGTRSGDSCWWWCSRRARFPASTGPRLSCGGCVEWWGWGGESELRGCCDHYYAPSIWQRRAPASFCGSHYSSHARQAVSGMDRRTSETHGSVMGMIRMRRSFAQSRKFWAAAAMR